MRYKFLNLRHLSAFLSAALLLQQPGFSEPGMDRTSPDLQWTAYRLSSDINTPLNDSNRWLAAENRGARIPFDQPFRIRIEVEALTDNTTALELEYREKGSEWKPLGYSDFPYPKFATPPVSIVSARSYSHGEETEDLLFRSKLEHEEGLGLSGVSMTPLFKLEEASTEWIWSLVIRRFSDGAAFLEDGSEFEIRVVDHVGRPLAGNEPIKLVSFAPEGHLGGTFVETPGRIGPYQSSQGTLYFIMEPTETDNPCMIVASHDNGKSWRELDGANRPSVGDLEGVGSVFVDGVIHIIHQTSDAVYHHAFATEDASEVKDQWTLDSKLVAEPSEPPTQSAALTLRPNGDLLAVYGSETGGWLQTGKSDGNWRSKAIPLETSTISGLSGFQVETDSTGHTYIVYSAANGTGWLRVVDPKGELSEPMLVSDTLGIEDEENGPFLPVLTQSAGGAALIYRKADASLWERRYHPDTGLTPPTSITQGPVVSSAVDSDQVGADAVVHGNDIHLLFINEADRGLCYTTRMENSHVWSPPIALVTNIEAFWVRGNLLHDSQGKTIYGFVYDAGSAGGAGMNRFDSIPLHDSQ